MATKRKQARASSGTAGRGRGTTGGTRASGRGRSTAQRAASGGAATRTPDAIRLLKQDHREVEKLVGEFEGARSARKAQIADEICRQLTVHAQIEEEIFYPAAREALKEEDLVDEAAVEHTSVKDLIAQIRDGGPDDALFEARVTVLGEYVKHHVREEEKEMFTQLQPRKIDLQALGERLMRRKQELLEGGSAGARTAIPRGTRAMDDDEDTGDARTRGDGARSSRDGAPALNAGMTRE